MTQKLKNYLAQIVLYTAIFLVIYTAFTWYRQPKTPDSPVWQMASLDGNVIDIKAMSQDRAVLLYFWGSWCQICNTTSPKLNELSKSAQVVTIAVSSGNDNELSAYLAQKDHRFITINDDDGQIFHAWRGQVTPSYVIIKDGKVVQSFVGIQPLWILRARLFIAN